MFEGFSCRFVDTGDNRIFVAMSGTGPPLLLLHGFPQTHLMWRDVAPALARRFTVVCADLRGYGDSGCPPSDAGHRAHSKRTMAAEMVAVMEHLGFDAFCVAGHDRGGRVAHRLALDHPARVLRMAVLDIIPTEAAFSLADAEFALGFWPWSLFSQAPPLPERVLSTLAEEVVAHVQSTWGPQPRATPAEVRAAYVRMLRDPARAHAICEEFRAAASIDREHDRQTRADGERIACPLLALWSEDGPLETWYRHLGGPLGIWRQWAVKVDGHAMPGGHFFPEQAPEKTTAALERFFRD